LTTGNSVEAEIGIADRTAQAYMSAARLEEAKGATVALLPPATVYRLAAKSTPAEVVDVVVARAKSGDKVSDRAVRDMLEEVKFQQRQAEASERQSARDRKMGTRKREQRERDRQEREAQQQRERLAVQRAAAAIRDRFSADDVAFIVEQFSAGDGLGPIEVLHTLKQAVAGAVA
jgi:vacuolar-type H+-ATPase subunit I/STV1